MEISPPTIDEFEWDDWNLVHIQKHDVTPEEVEQIPGVDATYQTSYRNRIMMIGPTLSGRMLTVIIGASPSVPGRWYVFSARTAHRKERAQHRAWKTRGIEWPS